MNGSAHQKRILKGTFVGESRCSWAISPGARATASVTLDAAILCIAQGISDVLMHRAAHKDMVQFGEFENANTLKSYETALSLLRLALQDPVQSKKGESLFAALLICSFEVCFASTCIITDSELWLTLGLPVFSERKPVNRTEAPTWDYQDNPTPWTRRVRRRL